MGNIVSISTIGQDSHRFGEPCGETTIKLGGIDIPFDKPIEARNKYQLAMLYHIKEHKGIPTAIAAINIVKKKYPTQKIK